MSSRLKGFIFGALGMLITPALAIPTDTAHVANNQEESLMPALEQPYFQLTYEDAEAAIAEALADMGAGAKISTQMNRSEKGKVIFSYSHPISVEIRGLRFDEKTNRFTTNLVAISGDAIIKATPASGRYDEMVEVPVLKRSKQAGDIINATDLEIRDYTAARTRIDTITDMASLIGKSPVRVITAGRPIREQEIAKPSLVKKNDMVTVHYKAGNMRITTQAQALQDGHAGSVISVKNLTSQKTLQAQVQDGQNVYVFGESGFTQTSQHIVKDSAYAY